MLAWAFSLVTALVLYFAEDGGHGDVSRMSRKRLLQFVIDGVVVVIALSLAYLFRFDGSVPRDLQLQWLLLLPYFIGLYLAANEASRVYAAMWRFTGIRDVARLALSVGMVSLLTDRNARLAACPR
jgi:hypothetical protein